MIKKIDHTVITTSVPEICLSFYKNLGFDIRNAGDRYEMFAGDFKINVHIKGQELSPHAKHIQTGSADLCFELSGSLVSFQAKLEENGIPVELGIVSRSGVNGPMKSIYVRDPDGNLLEFSSYDL